MRRFARWVRRHAVVVCFVIVIVAGFLVVQRLEQQADRIQQQDQILHETCEQRATARMAVRALFIDGYAGLAEVQTAAGIQPTDQAQLVAHVNEALPPLECD